MTISLAFEKQYLPSFSKMWWVSGGEQRFNERDAKMANYASCMGSKDLRFIAVLETEGHCTAMNISEDTLCRITCTAKRGMEGYSWRATEEIYVRE